jgi:hypothetical protein
VAYKQGAQPRITNVFKQSGVAADPTTVKLTIVRPDGQRNTYTYLTDAQIVKASTGTYYIDLALDIPGTWTYRWFSEGTGKAADDKTLIVEANLATDAPGEAKRLGIDYFELQRAVGRELRIGRDPGTWQPNERRDVNDIIRSGTRRFYWHEPLTTSSLQGKDGQVQKLKQTPVTSWSFMETTATISLVAATNLYPLPDDFGEMLRDEFIYTTDQQPIALVSYEQILKMQAKQTSSGPPKYAAISNIDATSTQYQVTFYPTPDAAYTLKYTYSVSPKELNENNPIPLGGPIHAETILEACLAACEKVLHGTEGVHEKKFLECLARSIQADANLTKPTEDTPWPLEDKANGLNINKAYLKRRIGLQMEYGAHTALWNHKQASEVDLALETGLRKFYSPMVLPGEAYSYDWKFLKPIGTITTESGISSYDLPAGFICMEGPLTFAPDEGDFWPSLEIVPEYRVRQKLAQDSSSGRPRFAAIRVKPIDPAGGTRYEVLVSPPADGTYEISYRYQVNPAGMDNDACLPYGGQQHAQTLIEACLAAAEEQMDVKNGPHAQAFVLCLQASVSSDRKTSAAEFLGPNLDGSDRVGEWRESIRDTDWITTVNGVAY